MKVASNRKAEPAFTLDLLFHPPLFNWLAWYAFSFYREFIHLIHTSQSRLPCLGLTDT